MGMFKMPAVVVSAAFLALVGCASPTSSRVSMQDVSSTMAQVAAELVQGQTTSVQSSMVDESSAIQESNTTVASRSAAGSAVVVVVSHSQSAGLQTFANGDVATVTRTWTNGSGEAVSDVVVRPHIPAPSDFSGTPVAWSPVPAQTGVSASFSTPYWTLHGTDVRTVNGIVLSTVDVTWVFQYTNSAVNLVSITKAGESAGTFTGDVKLDTTIYYYYDTTAKANVEFLRVMDYVNGTNKLDRLVYAWSVNPGFAKSAATSPLWSSSSGTLGFTPSLAAETGSATIDFWYHSTPGVTLASTPAYTGTGSDLSSYPVLDTARWVGSVLQESGPRIADWYKPTVTAGSYVRRETITTAPTSTSIQFYGADGTTMAGTVSGGTFRTASNGTITTTRLFPDGIESTVVITPQYNLSADLVTGYIIVRKSTTYTVNYTFDATGAIISLTVANSTTGITHTYVPTAAGGWAQSS